MLIAAAVVTCQLVKNIQQDRREPFLPHHLAATHVQLRSHQMNQLLLTLSSTKAAKQRPCLTCLLQILPNPLDVGFLVHVSYQPLQLKE